MNDLTNPYFQIINMYSKLSFHEFYRHNSDPNTNINSILFHYHLSF
jgi:hypothetical protein